jgi:hypothetical protein
MCVLCINGLIDTTSHMCSMLKIRSKYRLTRQLLKVNLAQNHIKMRLCPENESQPQDRRKYDLTNETMVSFF